jgi:hypothetical protein
VRILRALKIIAEKNPNDIETKGFVAFFTEWLKIEDTARRGATDLRGEMTTARQTRVVEAQQTEIPQIVSVFESHRGGNNAVTKFFTRILGLEGNFRSELLRLDEVLSQVDLDNINLTRFKRDIDSFRN